jgi:transposase-like protein
MKTKAKRGPKDRFTDEQKAEALAMIWRRDLTLEQVAASMGVSGRTIQRWRVRLERTPEANQMTSAERRRLRELERENAALKLQLEIQKKLDAISRRTSR